MPQAVDERSWFRRRLSASQCRPREWSVHPECRRAIDVNNRVELMREVHLVIVTGALGPWRVDDPDESLQQPSAECFPHGRMITERQKKGGSLYRVKQCSERVGTRRLQGDVTGSSSPGACRAHAAIVRGQSHEH